MREYNKDVIDKINKKMIVTRQNSFRYLNMYNKYKADNLKNKSDRLKKCLDYWLWDKYQQNKVLDLKKVNRCMDNRFCPNCRALSLSDALVNFKPKHEHMIKQYYPYMLTITVPNVRGEVLNETIKKMNKAFTKFHRWFHDDKKNSFKNRYFKIAGTVKVLEVTVQKTDSNMYHPHFHCITYLDLDNLVEAEQILDKNIKGAYSKKRKDYIYYSEADIQVMKLWKFAFDNIRISNYKNLEKYPNEFIFEYDKATEKWFSNYYQCDLRPLDTKGVYEVFKYTFKDTDIKTQSNFETLYLALDKKRIRQGYGLLYNLDLECEDTERDAKEDLSIYLTVNKNEAPTELITQELNTLLNLEYHDYKKISRFKNYSELDNIE